MSSQKYVFSYIGSNITIPGDEPFHSAGPGYVLTVRNTVDGITANVQVGFFDTESIPVEKLSQSIESNTAGLFWCLLNDIRYALNWDVDHIEFVPNESNNGAEDFLKAAAVWQEFIHAQ